MFTFNFYLNSKSTFIKSKQKKKQAFVLPIRQPKTNNTITQKYPYAYINRCLHFNI